MRSMMNLQANIDEDPQNLQLRPETTTVRPVMQFFGHGVLTVCRGAEGLTPMSPITMARNRSQGLGGIMDF